jgi:hypothetical protein
MVGALTAAALSSPAAAAPEPSAKLVRCGAESCLRLSGYRETPASIIQVNGYTVRADGERRWAVELPVNTVRNWSPLHARTIEVTLVDPATERSETAEVDLPIGLLGDVTRLASLVVSVG